MAVSPPKAKVKFNLNLLYLIEFVKRDRLSLMIVNVITLTFTYFFLQDGESNILGTELVLISNGFG